MRFLHTADLHLTSPRKAEGTHRLEVLRTLCHMAREYDALVIAGDVFDSAAEAPALHETVKEILTSINPVPVLIVSGNHDLLRGDNPFDGRYDFGQGINVRLLAASPFEKIEIAGAVFYGFPFQQSKTTSELFRELPPPELSKPRVAVLHGTPWDIPELSGFAAGAENAEEGGDLIIKNDDLRQARFVYAALGHIHKPAVWQAERCTLSFPGAPDAVRITETEGGTANAVEIDKESKITVTRLPVPGALRALRKQFFVFPGGEDEFFDKADAFLAANGAAFRTGIVVEGIADLNRVQEHCLTLGDKWRGLPVPPHFRVRAEQTQDSSSDMIIYTFIRKMQEMSAEEMSDDKRDFLRRSLVIGWRALTNKPLDPESLTERLI
ncbi:MAG: metallophosphoesterase family protein [Elusimicrobiaceae bacterium]|nr:metallophosphoesterase family protein [Elusimicrobiaceae bacterium]